MRAEGRIDKEGRSIAKNPNDNTSSKKGKRTGPLDLSRSGSAVRGF
jgi:hypothetical protein